jgi:hypothetical protein
VRVQYDLALYDFLTSAIFRAKPVSVMANSDRSEQVSPEQPAQASPEKPPASPHDTLVYKFLSDPVLAAAELKVVLPKEVADEIAWENLELDSNRFVTDNLDNQFTDLLYKTTIRNHDIRIRILLEHSSHAKPFELLQTLQYQVRQWERDVQQKKHVGSPQRLTPILTFILHHSETGWRGRTRFIDYFGLDDDLARLLRPYVVDFGIVLDDISKVNTEALMQRPVQPEVQIMLFVLRYGRSGRKILDELPKITPAMTVLVQDPNGRVVFDVFCVYIKRVAKLSEAEMRTWSQEFIDSQLDPEMVAVWTQFENGVKEGELKKARSMLQRQLAQRFGALSSEAVARLESASLDELDAMTLRVLTASTVDEVLGEPR